MLTVGLRDVRLHAPHGVHPEEALLGGEFVVHLSCRLRPPAAALGDRLSATLNYGDLYAICREVFAVRVDLIETLAERISARVWADFATQVDHLNVTIEKLHPPLGGRVGAAFVQLAEDGPPRLPDVNLPTQRVGN